MHVRLWPRVSWESTPGHGGPHAGGCRSGGTGPEASHDVTAASSELAMITSSRGSPKRLGFSENALSRNCYGLLRSAVVYVVVWCWCCSCWRCCSCILLLLFCYATFRETTHQSAVRAVRKTRSYISNGWASRPVASDGVDRVSVAAGLAPPPRKNIIKVDPCERGPCAHGCPNNKHLVVGLS